MHKIDNGTTAFFARAVRNSLVMPFGGNWIVQIEKLKRAGEFSRSGQGRLTVRKGKGQGISSSKRQSFHPNGIKNWKIFVKLFAIILQTFLSLWVP